MPRVNLSPEAAGTLLAMKGLATCQQAYDPNGMFGVLGNGELPASRRKI